MADNNYRFEIDRQIVISHFPTIDYYRLDKDFYQYPDSHPYWEMVYVDQGDIISNYNGIGHTLQEGQVIFHPPHSLHSHFSNKLMANSILVVSFDSNSTILENLKQKCFLLSNHSQKFLEKFIKICNQYLGDITNITNGLPKQLSIDSSNIGASHIIEMNFVMLLYSIIHDCQYADLTKSENTNIIAANTFIELLKSYLHDNVYNTLTLNDLCNKFNMSKSNLFKKWKEHSDIGLIDYFINIKMKEAKRLIKRDEYSISQISDMLGYHSIHHFSHSFKTHTGVSPREYKKSIM